MDVVINPGQPLQGEITLPGDKSISHRAALFGAMAVGTSRFGNFLLAGVTKPLLKALSDLGVEWEISKEKVEDREQPLINLNVMGPGIDRFQPPLDAIDCGNSGGTIRFLTGALAAAGISATLDGSEGLRQRPMARIVDPLRLMGVEINAINGGRAPLRIYERQEGSFLQSIDYSLPVASAQVKTALVLAALRAEGPSHFWEPYQSRDHTERMLSAMGAGIHSISPSEQKIASGVRVDPLISDLSPLDMVIPGDFSSGAFLITAALVTPGSEITIRGVGLNPTRTGLLKVLRGMEASIKIENELSQGGEVSGDLLIKHSQLSGGAVFGGTVVEMIDEFPVFGVAAAYASGSSEASEAQELRYKESDRIGTLCQELLNLGVPIVEKGDGFSIPGGDPPVGGEVESHGDHRLEMALAVAGLAAQSPTRIKNAGIYSESYPDFFETLQSLGANIQYT